MKWGIYIIKVHSWNEKWDDYYGKKLRYNTLKWFTETASKLNVLKWKENIYLRMKLIDFLVINLGWKFFVYAL